MRRGPLVAVALVAFFAVGCGDVQHHYEGRAIACPGNAPAADAKVQLGHDDMGRWLVVNPPDCLKIQWTWMHNPGGTSHWVDVGTYRRETTTTTNPR